MKRFLSNTILLYIGIFYLCSVPLFTHAQSVSRTDVSSLFLTANPPYPEAGQDVTVTAQSSLIDLNRSTIVWYMDGKVVQQGKALKSITVVTGNYGTTKTVRAVAVSAENRVVESSLSIAPTELNLLWQAHTYTPPFYKGKAAFSNSADITLVAIPGRGTYTTKDLIYTWKKDDEIIENTGGLGNNTITIKNNSIARPMMVSVSVDSVDRKYHGFKRFELSPVFPKIEFYENHPTLGVQYEHALATGDSVRGGELSLEAYPYFFSTPNRFSNDLRLSWQVNSQSIFGAANKPAIIIRGGAQATTATISLQAQNSRNVLQLMTKNITLNLNAQ